MDSTTFFVAHNALAPHARTKHHCVAVLFSPLCTPFTSFTHARPASFCCLAVAACGLSYAHILATGHTRITARGSAFIRHVLLWFTWFNRCACCGRVAPFALVLADRTFCTGYSFAAVLHTRTVHCLLRTLVHVLHTRFTSPHPAAHHTTPLLLPHGSHCTLPVHCHLLPFSASLRIFSAFTAPRILRTVRLPNEAAKRKKEESVAAKARKWRRHVPLLLVLYTSFTHHTVTADA